MLYDLPITQSPEQCRHLLSKGLYLNQETLPGDQQGDGNYWCGKTQTVFGPDNQLCDREDCLKSGRSCYEPL